MLFSGTLTSEDDLPLPLCWNVWYNQTCLTSEQSHLGTDKKKTEKFAASILPLTVGSAKRWGSSLAYRQSLQLLGNSNHGRQTATGSLRGYPQRYEEAGSNLVSRTGDSRKMQISAALEILCKMFQVFLAERQLEESAFPTTSQKHHRVQFAKRNALLFVLC